MDSCELVVLVSSLACQIASGHSREEIELIAAVFSQLGDTLATILAHQGACQSGEPPE